MFEPGTCLLDYFRLLHSRLWGELMKVKILILIDRFDILLEKRLGGAVEQ